MDTKIPPSQPAVHLSGSEPEDTNGEQGIIRPPSDWHVMTSQPVFVVEDSFFRSRTPRPVHWSIAWSDLMMTMFILFLTLFIYQLAHRHFLDEEEVRIVAGASVDILPEDKAGTFPFAPISPQLSQKKTDPLLSVQRVEEKAIREEAKLQDKDIPVTTITEQTQVEKEEPPVQTEEIPPVPKARVVPQELEVLESQAEFFEQPETQERFVQETTPELTESQKEIIAEIYDLSKIALADEKLRRFASVEVIPDKAVRIVLTGDLLFASGQADLSPDARLSLIKLKEVIAHTPYMINVVGHTDSVPISSELFPSNWELSVARASRVARFLIDDIGVSEKQLVVSGFSYFRPLRPNTTEQNRRANRRVEIILSKEAPPAVPADETSVQ